MVEFVAGKRVSKTCSDLAPSTLRGYLCGIQRALLSEGGYSVNTFKHLVFTASPGGVVVVLDNKIKELQGTGKMRKGHVLSLTDIETLYLSNCLSKTHPRGFITRLIFDVASMTAFRPGELAELQAEVVTHATASGHERIRIVGRVGGLHGNSKNRQEGLKMVNHKQPKIFIRNKVQTRGFVNVFEDVSVYLSCIGTFRKPTDIFFFFVPLTVDRPFSNGFSRIKI